MASYRMGRNQYRIDINHSRESENPRRPETGIRDHTTGQRSQISPEEAGDRRRIVETAANAIDTFSDREKASNVIKEVKECVLLVGGRGSTEAFIQLSNIEEKVFDDKKVNWENLKVYAVKNEVFAEALKDIAEEISVLSSSHEIDLGFKQNNLLSESDPQVDQPLNLAQNIIESSQRLEDQHSQTPVSQIIEQIPETENGSIGNTQDQRTQVGSWMKSEISLETYGIIPQEHSPLSQEKQDNGSYTNQIEEMLKKTETPTFSVRPEEIDTYKPLQQYLSLSTSRLETVSNSDAKGAIPKTGSYSRTQKQEGMMRFRLNETTNSKEQKKKFSEKARKSYKNRSEEDKLYQRYWMKKMNDTNYAKLDEDQRLLVKISIDDEWQKMSYEDKKKYNK